jgi:hypothetical protein
MAAGRHWMVEVVVNMKGIGTLLFYAGHISATTWKTTIIIEKKRRSSPKEVAVGEPVY